MEQNKVIRVAPFFHVRDVRVAAEYYVSRLGFTLDRYWGEPPQFAMPSRNGTIVMLSQAQADGMVRSNNPDLGATEGPWDAYFWVDDTRAMFEECRHSGANIVYGPTFMDEYENWEFGVRDADSYLLAFGSDGRNQ